MIEKIANLNGLSKDSAHIHHRSIPRSLEHLKILSLGRNLIKNLVGLVSTASSIAGRPFARFFQEAVGDTLEELWISYNQIEKLKGIGGMKKLKVLYMSNNVVKDWIEFQKLVSPTHHRQTPLHDLSQAELHTLQELVFTGNPLHEKFLEDNDGKQEVWQAEVQKRLKPLKKLDGKIIALPRTTLFVLCLGLHIIREQEGTD